MGISRGLVQWGVVDIVYREFLWGLLGVSAVGLRGRHSWRGWSGESSTSCIENFCGD